MEKKREKKVFLGRTAGERRKARNEKLSCSQLSALRALKSGGSHGRRLGKDEETSRNI
jgi:hypothetical protein